MNNRILLSTILLLFLSGFTGSYGNANEEEYGPPNLLKTMKTPFSGTVIQKEIQEKRKQKNELESNRLSLETISLASARPKSSGSLTRSLRKSLVPSRVYLPERMFLGQPAKFVVKGKAGSKVALAMADTDSGSKPVLGHELRLGPDRKLIAVGKIPASGVLELYIGTPIQGDLVGSQLFFEAALWTKEDMSDMELADTITANSEIGKENGVFIAGEIAKKRGIRIVPDTQIPLSQRRSSGLSGGQP